MHGGEVLAEPAAPGADRNDLGYAGTRSAHAAQLGPRIAHRAHGVDRGQRQTDVTVEPLGLLERVQTEHEVVAVDLQLRHGADSRDGWGGKPDG